MSALAPLTLCWQRTKAEGLSIGNAADFLYAKTWFSFLFLFGDESSIFLF
jgi:hypothetical protein